jgi:hypothetical protein
MNQWIFGVLLTMALKKRGGWSQFQSNYSPRLLLPYLPTFTNNDSSEFCLGFHEVGTSRIRPYFEGISPWKKGLKNVVGTSKTSVPGMALRFCYLLSQLKYAFMGWNLLATSCLEAENFLYHGYLKISKSKKLSLKHLDTSFFSEINSTWSWHIPWISPDSTPFPWRCRRHGACGAAIGLQGEVGAHHGDSLWTWQIQILQW